VKVRIGTRGSRLALAQSELMAETLRDLGAEVKLIPIGTSGDRLAQVALADFGGKAMFVKEIEEALLAGEVDLGVHSLKDMPAALPAGLCLGAVPRRDDPADVLVTAHGGTLADLPRGAVVGSSSLRRRALLLARRPDLRIEPIRGNVDTRLRKLEEGQYDALVVAAAGLNRLGLAPAHAVRLSPEEFLPAVGQGILGLEARHADRELLELLDRLNDTESRAEAEAERAFLLGLGADCHTPVAGWARPDGDGSLALRGLVASLDGRTVVEGSATGPMAAAAAIGRGLAGDLLARGAAAILDGGRGSGG
jgi:hydroxymethylbilane synthase